MGMTSQRYLLSGPPVDCCVVSDCVWLAEGMGGRGGRFRSWHARARSWVADGLGGGLA